MTLCVAPLKLGRPKVQLVENVLVDGWACEKAAPRSLRPPRVEVGYRMSLTGLGPREQGPTTMNPDTCLSMFSQGVTGHRCIRCCIFHFYLLQHTNVQNGN